MSVPVRIAPIFLDALPHLDPRQRRENRARTCWQIQDLVGHSMNVGLWTGPALAAHYANSRGWRPGGFPGGK